MTISRPSSPVNRMKRETTAVLSIKLHPDAAISLSGLNPREVTIMRQHFGSMVALLLAVWIVTAPAAAQTNEPEIQDLNTIIRALAPGLEEAYGLKPRSIDLDIRFALDSADLSSVATRQLDELGRALESDRLKNARFVIAGHTDATGPADYNEKLSFKRAAVVVAYLVRVFGLDHHRFEVAGFGEEKLKDTEAPASAVNRRVEVTLIPPQRSSQPTGSAGGKEDVKIKW